MGNVRASLQPLTIPKRIEGLCQYEHYIE